MLTQRIKPGITSNKKPPMIIVGAPGPRPAVPEAPQTPTPGQEQSSREEGDRDPGEPQTPIVRALIEALDEAETDDDEAKDRLRRALVRADVQLRETLGDNSRRKIEEANRKPAVPVVHEPPPGTPPSATPPEGP